MAEAGAFSATTIASVLLALAAVTAFALLARLLLDHLIRRSLRAPRVAESSVPDGLPWCEVTIAGARGKTLFGWFIPAGECAPAMAIVHGWGGNAEMMLPLAGPLHTAGYALLFFDARCHGRSDDDSFASLPRFAEDLAHAVDWLACRREVDARLIGVIGNSVGGAAALLLASERKDLAAAVALAAFAHPEAVMRRWLHARRIPYWPLGAYILGYVQRVIGRRFADIAPCHTIRAAGCPVLLVHGSDDATVPVGDARQIYARRRDERVSLLLIPGSHDGYAELERHIDKVIAFLDDATRPPDDERAAEVSLAKAGEGK